ncbi:hypothetical protein ACQEVF_02245 [Nonomuraea polychroma]|uniref:hypothetical protein n=1 Tax=Nonomuraea polychroma TaxID=46176 RepID=UPI003D8B48AF
MTKRLVDMLLAATVATGVLSATPTAASASATSTTAGPHLIDYKIYFGKCEDTCRIKVRIKNVSRKRLYDVSLNARLWTRHLDEGIDFDTETRTNVHYEYYS